MEQELMDGLMNFSEFLYPGKKPTKYVCAFLRTNTNTLIELGWSIHVKLVKFLVVK